MQSSSSTIRAFMVVAVVSVVLSGCRCSSPDQPEGTVTVNVRSTARNPDTMVDFHQVLTELQDADVERREGALQSIEQLAKGELSQEQVSALIAASTKKYPPPKFEWSRYEPALLMATWGHLRDSHVKQLSAVYPRLNPQAQPAALAALARLGSAAATHEYVRLLQHHGWPSNAYPAVLLPFEQDPKFADTILPPFTDGAIARVPTDARWRLVLAYASRDLVPDGMLPAVLNAAVNGANAALDRTTPFQRGEGIGWRWEESYSDARLEAGLLLDVLGHLDGSPDAVAALRRAELLADPYLQTFAAASLARLDQQPSEHALTSAAGDPETRNVLFDLLSAAKKRELFPPGQLHQERLAESDMVRWLLYPTELGRAPDEIELMKTVEVDAGSSAGVFVYYVFRFKTRPPHWSAADGWTAGVSGPFAKREFPTTEAWGDTFSTFTKWEEFSPEEHLSSTQELMELWRENRNKQ